MKNGFGIGLVLAVVLLGAAIVVPRFLVSGQVVAAEEARRTAEQAQRELAAYAPTLSALALRADLVSLKDADLSKLDEKARTEIPDLLKEAKDAANANARRPKGMPAGKTPVMPNDFHGAVSELDRIVKENEALLANAERDAQAAVSKAGNVPGVPQVAGMVKLMQAHVRWAEALRLRSELAARQREALSLTNEWSLNRSQADQYHGMDTAKIRADLTNDQKEIEAEAAAAAKEAADLDAAVATRQSELQKVRDDLKHARAVQLTLEEKGFTPGDDRSLDAYHGQYQPAAQQVQKLQEREQLLATGGAEGAQIADEDWLNGALQGGTAFEGLDRLEARAGEAKVRAERLANAVKALQMRGTEMETMGKEAHDNEQRYIGTSERIQNQFKQVQQAMEAAAKAAFEKEDAALQAARAAVTSFRSAKSAADGWVNAARQLQQSDSLDPQQKNERLRKIATDSMTPGLSDAAAAEAQTLVGRILANRAEAVSAYSTNLERMTRVVQGATFDAESLKTVIETARTEAVTALTDAKGTYERVSGKASPAQWPQLVSLATVDYLLSKLDTPNAERYLADATDSLKKAVSTRTQNAYVGREVLMLANQLGALNNAGSGDTSSQPSGNTPPSGG